MTPCQLMWAIIALRLCTMPEQPSLELHSVSVVVTAEFHNPSILNPDFLAACEIVPEDWVATERLTTPPLSVVKYDNGVRLTVDQTKLAVIQEGAADLSRSNLVHDIARAYLSKLPHVPYRDLGLNCQVSVRKERPRRWLLNRFAASWLQKESSLRGMRPKLALLADNAMCNISLFDVQEGQEGRVVADCNLHHAGPLTMKAMYTAIEHWPERLAFVSSSVSRLLGST